MEYPYFGSTELVKSTRLFTDVNANLLTWVFYKVNINKPFLLKFNRNKPHAIKLIYPFYINTDSIYQLKNSCIIKD